MEQRRWDPRIFQLFFLGALFLFSLAVGAVPLDGARILAVFFAGLSVQGLAIRQAGLPWPSLLSAGITCLSVLLLCHSDSAFYLAAVVTLALASKFLAGGRKHFFNPANFGIVVMLLLTHGVWVSPGQWGEGTLAFWALGFGLMIVTAAERLDVSVTFLAAYAGLCALRVYLLGQSWAVLSHQLQSGTLVVFSFFMISDPRSTPNRRAARVVFALAIALTTFVFKFSFYQSAAPLFALFCLSPFTPWLDRRWPGEGFEWGFLKVSYPLRRESY